MTGFEFIARVPAVLVDAGELRRTVTVHSALWRLVHGHFSVFTHEPCISVGVTCRAATARYVLEHVALGVRSAVVGVRTRVNTFTVVASFVSRTIRVFFASSHVAMYEGVSNHATRTSALGLMNFWVAFGIESARIVHVARIHTNAIITHLIQGTLFVFAASNFVATRFWVTLVAFETLAHRPVIYDGALCIVAAVARHDALCVEAGTVRWAVTVGSAANTDRHFEFDAELFFRYHHKRRAIADHGSEASRVHKGALLRGVTRTKLLARITASLVHADQSFYAIKV